MFSKLHKLVVLSLLCPLQLLFSGDGNLLKNGDFSQGTANWNRVKVDWQTASGELIVRNPDEVRDPHSRLVQQKISLEKGKRYQLSFQIRNEKRGIMRAVYQLSERPYSACGLVQNWELEPGTHAIDTIFKATYDGPKPTVLTLNLSRLPGRIVLRSIQLKEVTLPQLPFALNSEWQAFCNVKPPRQFRNMPELLDGKKPMTVQLKDNCIDLRNLKGTLFQPSRSTAVLYNHFHSSEAGLMRIGFTADWFFDIYFNGVPVLKGSGVKPFSIDSTFEDFPVKKGENLLVAVVRAGWGDWKFFCGKPQNPVVFRENGDWKAYRMSSPVVKADTALDLSAEVDAPAGELGRLTVSERGELVFEKEPDKPVRLLGFNGMKNLFETQDNEEFKARAREFARAARRQGYRLFRLHALLDRWLCQDSANDMEINPFYLDRWDYLISELKKEGIYVYLVVFSFHLYAKSADNARTFADRTLHKMMMYLDGKWEMDRFRYAVNTLFRHVNPYTGMAWKDDPVIAFVEYYNEQALGLGGRIRPMLKQNPEAERHLLKYWRAFLEKKYGRPMKDAPIPPSSEGKAGNDFALFWQERAVQCAKQCEAIIRAAGYRGLVTNFSAAKNLGHSAARWEIAPVVDIHAYFNHPSNWMRRGSIIAQNSSIAAATGYWKNANSVKLTGRPFLCGEYNHCFWNPYRYELGMVYGGYSALQGYGALMVHEQAVLLDDSAASAPVNCFSVGNSPLLRASQFLTACLFQRGDVRTSPHQVSLLVPRKFWTIDANAEKGVSSSQAMLGLLAGYGLLFPEEKAAPGVSARPASDLVLPISGSAGIETHGWFTEVVESQGGEFSLDAAVKTMREKGILSRSNRTAPERGIFQSDTEELTLERRTSKLQILTPRTEAICMKGGTQEELRSFRIRKNTADSCVALCAIDGRKLAESSRMILLYMTEEANSNMILSANRAALIEAGGSPVLTRTGILELELPRRPGSWKLHALGIDGSRRESIPVKRDGNSLRITLDTRSLQSGPTPFFELIAEE